MFTNTVTRSCAILATFMIFCKGTVFSQLQNEGVLGASFYGETMDSTGSIRNQVGPHADFALPVGLSFTLMGLLLPRSSLSLALNKGARLVVAFSCW